MKKEYVNPEFEIVEISSDIICWDSSDDTIFDDEDVV